MNLQAAIATISTLKQPIFILPYVKHYTHTHTYIYIYNIYNSPLTHWGRVTQICVDNITIIGSDNGLSPGRRQAIIWTNAGILLIRPLGTNFSEILIGNQTFSFKKIHLKMSSAKWRPFCLGLNELKRNITPLYNILYTSKDTNGAEESADTNTKDCKM